MPAPIDITTFTDGAIETIIADHRLLHRLAEVLAPLIGPGEGGMQDALEFGITEPSGIAASVDPKIQMEFAMVPVWIVHGKDGLMIDAKRLVKVFNPSTAAIQGSTLIGWMRTIGTGAAVAIYEDCP